ncbi:hypothetical protein [Methylomagnum ishizawai]|uniref:hypothetical protein n=1 Tax=Methylomagnum ishizawai TaxID=1760988 RepID=UPI001C33BC18|nr:hypothetical protein [Methylomagnum ishizawai]BBL77306.1 hypothetical protein MishRS11D_44040 [Methylomagnum ishizawai]
MAGHIFDIDAANSEQVRAYILRQFATRPWWPAAEPARAQAEFEAAQSDPGRIAAWCGKWLDGGQWRLLGNALRRTAG